MFRSLTVIASLSLIVFAACGAPTKQQGEAQQFWNVNVPRDMNNAEDASAINGSGACVVSLASPGEWYVGKEPVKPSDLHFNVEDQLKKSPGSAVYLQGSVYTEYGDVAHALSEIRRADVQNFNLVVGGKGDGSPLKKFAVTVPPEPSPSDDPKPNPSALQVEILPDGRLRLNGKDAGTVSQPDNLNAALAAALRGRDSGADKTVMVKPTLRTRYADVAKVIDAVKGAGARAIQLQLDDLVQ
jgi:biopolymer transport protein ExbD